MRALSRLTNLHAGKLLGLALVLFCGAGLLASQIFDNVDPFDIGDPDSEVARASAKVEDLTGQTAEPGVVLLVSAPPDDLAPAEAAARSLRRVPGVARVETARDQPALVNPQGDSLVLGFLTPDAVRVDVGEATVHAFEGDGEVTAGGTAVAAYQVGERSEDDTRKIELYAAPVLLLLLLLVFRTALASILPLAVAAFAIVVTMALLRLLTEATPIDLFALQTVTGLGTGLAIDYSLFILGRYREEIAAGEEPAPALRNTLGTAGRTVAYSALTVAAALASLIAFPQPFLHSTGIAGTLTALVAGLTALTVLPSIISKLGPAVDRLAVRRDPLRSDRGERSFWRRLPRAVCARPVSSLIVGTAVLLLLASQALGIELTTPDARELPEGDSARIVAESIDEFPQITETRLYALVPAAEAADPDTLASIQRVEEVALARPPVPLDANTSLIAIASYVDPLSTAGQDLVADVRDVLPQGSLLGGRAAEQADQRASIFDHAPLVILLVVVTNLLLLALITRSLLVPLIAVGLNLLTVAASIGVLVATFMTDLGASLLGTQAQDGIDMSVPVIAFAVGFGLSTDYGIFLLARIREERERGLDDGSAIVEAVSSTGRLISASAALLAIAVGAFVFSDLVIVKEFAVAIVASVILDATVVRGLLIPAVLKLLGPAAWNGRPAPAARLEPADGRAGTRG
jgi:RND superfamily putative drug exporter